MSFEDARKDCDYPQDGLKDPCSVAVNFMCVRAAEDGNFDGFSLRLLCQAKPMRTNFRSAFGRRHREDAAHQNVLVPRFGMLTDRFGLGWMIAVMA